MGCSLSITQARLDHRKIYLALDNYGCRRYPWIVEAALKIRRQWRAARPAA
jgi:hypothetical protein